MRALRDDDGGPAGLTSPTLITPGDLCFRRGDRPGPGVGQERGGGDRGWGWGGSFIPAPRVGLAGLGRKLTADMQTCAHAIDDISERDTGT